jgi:3-deoxy-manno-octulosonate cytidylyltransferase (CMP-KDO synthetase)
MIDLAVAPLLSDRAVVCTNLIAPIRDENEFKDSNTIKVVMGRNGDALFMSREPIPTRVKRPFKNITAFKQVCVIPFRRDFLLRYTELEPTQLEIAESIDMLRAIEHGFPVRMVRSDFPTQAVDTLDDLRRVEEMMRRDPLYPRYAPATA